MATRVRLAAEDDLPAIRRIYNEGIVDRVATLDEGEKSEADILEWWHSHDDYHAVFVAECDGAVVGCGALHVMWEDLAELRTVAVHESMRGEGIGHLIVDDLLDRARRVGVSRVFVLTFAVDFFGRHGFTEISGTPVAPEVYAELLRSYDDGVAEFLELDRVKPNTLGNTRMLLRL